MNKYYFRAECQTDIDNLLAELLPIALVCELSTQQHDFLPDIVVMLETDLSINEIKKAINEVRDCQVMGRTLQETSKYNVDFYDWNWDKDIRR